MTCAGWEGWRLAERGMPQNIPNFDFFEMSGEAG